MKLGKSGILLYCEGKLFEWMDPRSLFKLSTASDTRGGVIVNER